MQKLPFVPLFIAWFIVFLLSVPKLSDGSTVQQRIEQYSASIACQRPVESTTVGRIVAVGDLHGSLRAAVQVLLCAGVIDTAGHWAGGSTTLVFMGDYVDRKEDSRGVMELVMRLQVEASNHGGKVHPLLGNHEVMNLMGDLRYVHPREIELWGGSARRMADFSADGRYGAWLRTLDTVLIQNDTVFVHAGLLPDVASIGIEHINQKVRRELQQISGTTRSLSTMPDGPLWTRALSSTCEGYYGKELAHCEANRCKILDQTLRILGTRRMVIGHTITESLKPESRCSGRLVLIDTGMAYGNHRSALEIVGNATRTLSFMAS